MTRAGTIISERLGKILRLTISRPAKKNALTFALLDELVAAVSAAADDTETTVVIITGDGDCFSAGWDLQDYAGKTQTFYEDVHAMQGVNDKLEKIFSCPIPVIAQVDGYCLAGGSDIALSCDFLVMADEAKIGYPAVRSLGVPPFNLWIYRVGLQMAKRMLLTGDTIGGQEAVRIGLAMDSVPSGDLASTVLAFAERVSNVSRDCLIGNKGILNLGVNLMGRQDLIRAATIEDAIVHKSPAAEAFIESLLKDGASKAFRDRDSTFS